MNHVEQGETMLLMLYMFHNDTICISGGIDNLHVRKDVKIQKVLSEICLLGGSTFKGRVDASTQILKIRQKAPIVYIMNNMLFPTVSYNRSDCIWINPKGVMEYKRDGNETTVQFYNGFTINIPIEYRSFKRQMTRCKEYADFLGQHYI